MGRAVVAAGFGIGVGIRFALGWGGGSVEEVGLGSELKLGQKGCFVPCCLMLGWGIFIVLGLVWEVLKMKSILGGTLLCI